MLFVVVVVVDGVIDVVDVVVDDDVVVVDNVRTPFVLLGMRKNTCHLGKGAMQ